VNTEQRLLTAREVARLLRLHRVTVYKLVRRGVLRAVMLGNTYRFPADTVEQLLRREDGTARPQP